MGLIAIDIETVPGSHGASADSTTSQAADESKKQALDALTGQVICVGLLPVKDDDKADARVAIISPDERRLLTELWSVLERFKVTRFIAHNGLNFDLPFLWRRSVIHGVRPNMRLDLRRYRTDFMFDTMAVWANWDPRAYASLNDLARSLGVGSKNGSGEEVAQLWELQNYHKIGSYCLHDCWLTYACYCKLNFRPYSPEGDIPSSVRVLE